MHTVIYPSNSIKISTNARPFQLGFRSNPVISPKTVRLQVAISQPRIQRQWECRRQPHGNIPVICLSQRPNSCPFASNPAICRYWPPASAVTLLDGTQPRRGEVLARPGRISEPRIVGHVDHPRRTVGLIDHLSRENRFVANQRPDRRQPGMCNVCGPGPRRTRRRAPVGCQRAQSGWYSPNGTRCHLS